MHSQKHQRPAVRVIDAWSGAPRKARRPPMRKCQTMSADLTHNLPEGWPGWVVAAPKRQTAPPGASLVATVVKSSQGVAYCRWLAARCLLDNARITPRWQATLTEPSVIAIRCFVLGAASTLCALANRTHICISSTRTLLRLPWRYLILPPHHWMAPGLVNWNDLWAHLSGVLIY